jgi:hypothetical protein
MGIKVAGTEIIDASGNIAATVGNIDGRDIAADGTKLDGIETGADVTDTTNVVAALTAGTNVTIAADGTISSTDTNTTYSAGTGMSLSGTTFNCTIDSPSEVGLGNLSNNGNNLSGSFTATGNITAYSDARLKDNVTNIDNALNKVSVLRGVTYNRNDIENAPRHAGVIAQEVEKVLPEVVLTNEEGIKTVAYGNMVGLLIEAIKELKSEIEELKNGSAN